MGVGKLRDRRGRFVSMKNPQEDLFEEVRKEEEWREAFDMLLIMHEDHPAEMESSPRTTERTA